MNDAPLSNLLRKTIIKTETQLMVLSDSIWKEYPDTGRSTREYIILYQVGTIDHGTHVPGLVDQSGAESEYNASGTTGMTLAHFMMLTNELLNKNPDIFP